MRDLWQIRGQALAICLVIGCGVAAFVMCLSTLGSLEQTQASYYERHRFADVFTHLKRAPNALGERLGEIPGVAQVQTRILVDVSLDVPGLAEPAVGRLISVPEHGPIGLNDLYLRKGRFLAPGRAGEVLASEAFASAHGFEPGDRMTAIINGRQQRLTIVGIALSPEYIYAIRPGQLLPDPRRFAILWMDYRSLAAAYNMEGTFNDVTLSLMPNASEADVLERLDRLTGPYGGLGAYGRQEQISHKLVSDEIRKLRGTALIAPSIFLAVAAFLLNVVLSRLVHAQREQIATLKAFGYTGVEIGLHYLKMALAISCIGAILGTIAGIWLARDVTELFARFFRFPEFAFSLGPRVIPLALAISILSGGVGVMGVVRRVVRLPPAEAMRPEAPASFRPILLERLGLGPLLPSAARMTLRRLERHPVKTLLSCMGIALAMAILVLAGFTEDAVTYVIDLQLRQAQRQDLTVTFVEPISCRAIQEIHSLSGVQECEPFRAIATRIRLGPRSRRVGIQGMSPQLRLNRLLDQRGRAVSLPAEGLLLSEKLAEILQARPGDLVTVEVMEGQRPIRRLPVMGTIADFTGTSAYMDISAAHRLMGEGDMVSGVYLTASPGQEEVLYGKLKQTPMVAGVAVQDAMLESFRTTVSDNLLRMRVFNLIFATIIAVGVVYNTARIILAERARELATLRVIGFTRGEISLLFLGEVAVLTLAAVPIGIVGGYGFAWLSTLSYDTELFRIPFVVERSTFGMAVSVVLAASGLSALVVRRQLDQLDLVEVLKTKE
jgi:putative ABC transport system permease protein